MVFSYRLERKFKMTNSTFYYFIKPELENLRCCLEKPVCLYKFEICFEMVWMINVRFQVTNTFKIYLIFQRGRTKKDPVSFHK